ncbi:MAG: hypothetical protein QF464_09015, partial [Myxococcota bacterium]|nr:hypothetical protein [Myxococcota bacterium]
LLNEAGQAVTLDIQGSYLEALSEALQSLIEDHAAALGIDADDAVLLAELRDAIDLGAECAEPLARAEAHLASRRPRPVSATTLPVDLTGTTAADWTDRLVTTVTEAAVPPGRSVSITLTGTAPAGDDGLPCAIDLAAGQAAVAAIDGVGHVNIDLAPEVYGEHALATWAGAA